MNWYFVFYNLDLLLFSSASILYLLSSSNQKIEILRNGKLPFSLLVFGFVFALLGLVSRSGGLTLPRDASMMFVALLAFLSIVLHIKYKLKIIGVLIAPMLTLILLLDFFLLSQGAAGVSGGEISGAQKYLIYFHVFAAVTGQVFAIGACGISASYLWQQRALKLKRWNQVSKKIPALDRLESILVFSLWVGLVFITFGLVSGAVYAQQWSTNPNFSFKFAWAIVVWVYYLVVLVMRLYGKYSTKRIAQFSMFGLLLLSLSFFGMSLIGNVMGGTP